MQFSPSGRHVLAYARTVSLDIEQLSDATFRADTGVGVGYVERFPRRHMHGEYTQRGCFVRRLSGKWHMTRSSRVDYNTRETHRSSWRRLADTGEPTQTVRERINYRQLLSEFRDVQLGLGEFGVLSRAVDVDSETNTRHGNASRLRWMILQRSLILLHDSLMHRWRHSSTDNPSTCQTRSRQQTFCFCSLSLAIIYQRTSPIISLIRTRGSSRIASLRKTSDVSERGQRLAPIVTDIVIKRCHDVPSISIMID